MKLEHRNNVRIGEYDISADSLQWILSRVSTHKSGKNKGEESLVVMGYYSSLKSLVAYIADEEIKKQLADSTDIREMVENAMTKLIDDIVAFNPKYIKD